MATDDPTVDALLAQLASTDWSLVLEGVAGAEAWLRERPVGADVERVVAKLVVLSEHKKWEIRRAVANAAALVLHPAFDAALKRLGTDDNSRVRQAAQLAALRRRDWQNASTLGRQHEDRINAALDDIEAKYGVRGRDAVKRVSEQITNMFARELYHEVVSLLTPLALAADELKTKLAQEDVPRAELHDHAVEMEDLVGHLRAVLDAMRSYTAMPKLVFASEPIKKLVEDAAALARGGRRGATGLPAIEVCIDETITADLARDRLTDALKNVLTNALDAYEGLDARSPVIVTAEERDGAVVIVVKDAGCGMNEENLRGAMVLFSTSKPNGTGFGLPLAQKIVQTEHGGSLRLESAEGKGTTVEIVIPARRIEAAR